MPDMEDVKDDVLSEAESAIEFLANVHAAEAWSTPTDQDLDDFGEVYIIADFGGEIAVNGDYYPDYDKIPPVPRGFVFTRRGGRVPTTEEEISLEHVIDLVARELGLREVVVGEILQEEYGELIYRSIDGETEFYVPKGKGDE